MQRNNGDGDTLHRLKKVTVEALVCYCKSLTNINLCAAHDEHEDIGSNGSYTSATAAAKLLGFSDNFVSERLQKAGEHSYNFSQGEAWLRTLQCTTRALRLHHFNFTSYGPEQYYKRIYSSVMHRWMQVCRAQAVRC